jgi:hypothetical protein
MNFYLKLKFKTLNKSIDFDKSYILNDLKFGRQATSTNTEPSYGIISSYGNAKLADKLEPFEDSVLSIITTNDISDETIEVEIHLDGNMVFKSEAEINYDFANNIITLEFIDSLYTWQNVNFTYTFLEHYRTTQRTYITGLELYNKLKSATAGETFENLDADTSSRFGRIRFYLPNFKKTKLTELWDYFCKVTQSFMYRDNNGKIRVVPYVG